MTLTIRGLRLRSGGVDILHGIDLTVEAGEILGIVGESGSGKSMLLSSIMQLLPHPQLQISGSIVWQNQILLGANAIKPAAWRGRHIAMVFQDAKAALSPFYRIDAQLLEAAQWHLRLPASSLLVRAHTLMRALGLNKVKAIGQAFPHQLSLGMCQRLAVIMNLLLDPPLLLLDEPTSSLDAMHRQDLLQLLKAQQQQRHMSMVVVSHHLPELMRLADRVAVMYAGRLVELAPMQRLRDAPMHPYTQKLLQCCPSDWRQPMVPIPGEVENLPAAGCPFLKRCAVARPICATQMPARTPIAPQHEVACWANASP